MKINIIEKIRDLKKKPEAYYNSSVTIFEKNLETTLENLTDSTFVLNTVATMINLNSRRLVFMKKAYQTLLKRANLVSKEEQEKQAFQIQEMQFHILRLEAELKKIKKPEKLNVSKVKRNVENLV